jgi:hypothetical protein
MRLLRWTRRILAGAALVGCGWCSPLAAKDTLLRALLLFLGAQFLFNLVDATGKYLVRDFPVLTVAWASSPTW